MDIRISDLWDCAYLVCNGIEVTDLQVIGHNGKRSVYFIFSGPKADRLHREFIEGKARANITQLKLIMNHLKDLLFNKLREETENEKHRQRHNRKSQRRKQYS